MVSQRLHSHLSMIICGASYPEIDRLVDSPQKHDKSRYDLEELFDIYRHVYKRFGEAGLCSLVLHHYLDRLADKIVSLIYRYAGEGAEAYRPEPQIPEERIGDERFRRIIELGRSAAEWRRGEFERLMENICSRFAEEVWEEMIGDDRNILNLVFKGRLGLLLKRGSSTQPYEEMARILGEVVEKTLTRLKSHWRYALYKILTDKDSTAVPRRLEHALEGRMRNLAHIGLLGRKIAAEDSERIHYWSVNIVQRLIKCYEGEAAG